MFIIIIMRKKVLRVPKLNQKVLNKPIVTFDSKDHSHYLLEAVPRKTTPFQTFLKDLRILKASAAEASSVCLANNQIIQAQRMIALYKRPFADPKHSNGMSWISLNYQNPEDYEVFAQPEILKGSGLVEQHQESISFPLINFNIKRYNSITVKFKNERSVREERTLTGHLAWAFQQSLQQLNGIIPLDWRINHGNMYFLQQAIKYFPKSASILQQYSKDLKKVFQEYPDLITMKQSFCSLDQTFNRLQDQVLPFQEDYYRRLAKHYQKEMNLFNDRMADQGKERKWRDQKLDVEIIDK